MFERPTLSELVKNAQARMEASLRGVEPDELAGYELRRGDPIVLATTAAMAVHELYGALDYYYKQLFTRTCDVEHLEIDAAEWGITRKTASKAQGLVNFGGNNGVTIPADTLLRRASDDARFVVTEAATIADGAAAVQVEAELAGADGNTAADTSLYLVSPMLGVLSPGKVGVDGLIGGADRESDERLRARVLLRKQNPPQGGAEADFMLWALEVKGVTRAYVWPVLGGVNIAPLFDDSPTGPIPTAGEVELVQAYIDAVDDKGRAMRRPTCCQANVFALTAKPVNITAKIYPDMDAVKAAAKAELEDLIKREAEPGASIPLSQVNEALSIAQGEKDHILISPTENLASEEGELLVIGEITWQVW